MRDLGNFDLPSNALAPVLAVVVFSAVDNLPKFVWVQESQTDVMFIRHNDVLLDCYGVLNDCTIMGVRPQSGGAIKRVTCSLNFNTNKQKGYPIFNSTIGKGLYYGGSNFDDFYFAIYSIDRTLLNKDIRTGVCFGYFKVESEVAWEENEGIQNISLIDILADQTQIFGARLEETIPELFFIYNPDYQANFFPIVYGQVPRIKPLNAFPSFSIKKFTASITGTVRSDYDDTSTEIILEINVQTSSLLLQVANLGGKVRVRMHDNEVILGTLTYDPVAQTITLNVTTRDTYYTQIKGYNDSLDGRAPTQWGDTPSYVDTRFSPYQTIIPNAKEVILDQNGFMEADIWFYREAEFEKGVEVENVVCQIQGILDERKDVVIHTFWPDPDHPTYQNQGSVSGFYSFTSNETYLPADANPLWGVAAFEFLKFRNTPQNVRLYFNDPTTSEAGSGSVGDRWSLVAIEADSVDYSCYLRNGFSRFSVNNVYAVGESKLIKIPSENVTITQSGTFYGLPNLCKIALTASPIDMNIGAKTNDVLIDALYRDDNEMSNRSEKVLSEILKEVPLIYALASSTIKDETKYQEDNWLPYFGWYCYTETTFTDIVDRICYQLGITFTWVYDKFRIDLNGQNFNVLRPYIPPEESENEEYEPTHLEVTLPTFDDSEMLENTSGIAIGKLRTAKYSNGDEYIPLYFKVQYGGWQDPFYNNVGGQSNRKISPLDRIVDYNLDLINDQNSYTFAIGKMLSVGHASGYSSTQRKYTTEALMSAVRLEAMDAVALKRFPLVSTTDESNAIYTDDDRILYPIREDGKYYMMGAIAVVEEIQYRFLIQRPHVAITFRNAQAFVNANGIPIFNPPGPPTEPDVPSEDPNSPPNGTGGNGTNTTVGNDWLMPELITPPSAPTINSAENYDMEFTLTVDSGFIFNKGWSFVVKIVDRESPTGFATSLAASGAAIIADGAGAFPDKTGEVYVPIVYNPTIRVNYTWFKKYPLQAVLRNMQVILIKTWIEGESGELQHREILMANLGIDRSDLALAEGS